MESPGLGLTATVQLTSSGAPSVRQTPAKPHPALIGLHVLVIDDDCDARNLAITMLRRAGTCVCAASSAAEAFGLFLSQPFDLILCDISMPEENGYQFIQRVRGRESSQGKAPVPAAALTAHTRDEDREQSLAAGFHDHITKPYTYCDLTTAMARLITRSSATTRL